MEDPNLYITTVNTLSKTKVLDHDSLEISVYQLHLEKPFTLDDLENGNEMGKISLRNLKTQFKNKNIDLGLHKSSEYLIKWEEILKKIEFILYLNFVTEEEIIVFKSELSKEFNEENLSYINSTESTQKFKEQAGENAIFLTDELLPPMISIELNNSKKNQDLIKNWIYKNKDNAIIQRFDYPNFLNITWILRIKS